MKTTLGAVRPLANTWINDFIPGAFAPNPAFVQYKVNGRMSALMRAAGIPTDSEGVMPPATVTPTPPGILPPVQ